MLHRLLNNNNNNNDDNLRVIDRLVHRGAVHCITYRYTVYGYSVGVIRLYLYNNIIYWPGGTTTRVPGDTRNRRELFFIIISFICACVHVYTCFVITFNKRNTFE